MYKTLYTDQHGQQYLVTLQDGRVTKVAPIIAPPQSGQGQGQGDGASEQQAQSTSAWDKSQLSKKIAQAIQDEMAGKGVGRDTPNLPLSDEELEDELCRIDNAFKQRLSSVMTDNKYDRNLRYRTKGSLDMKHLWRAKTGAKNIFMQHQARKNKEYNFVLLIDQSGSMADISRDNYNSDGQQAELYRQREVGAITDAEYQEQIRNFYVRNRRWNSNIGLASRLAVLLVNHFQGLNLNIAVVGFTGMPEVIKRLDQQMSPVELFQATNTPMGGTYLTPAVKKGYELLRFKPNPFVIVLTDGELSPEDRETVRHLIKANPQIKLSGYGINANLQSVISTSWRVKGVEEIKPLLLRYLAQHIRRG